MDISDMGARSSSESSMVSSTFGESTTADFNEDTECLIRAEQNKAPNRFVCLLSSYFVFIIGVAKGGPWGARVSSLSKLIPTMKN